MKICSLDITQPTPIAGMEPTIVVGVVSIHAHRQLHQLHVSY